MKFNQVLQSIFLALILMGLFATMAQNGYGFTVIGSACFGLAILYIVQIAWKLFEDFSNLGKKDLPGIAELFLLAMLLLLFGLRAFYIHLPYIDYLFIMICILFIVVYFFFAMDYFMATKAESPKLARIVIFFYSSILLFLLSLGVRIISPSGSAAIGALGMLSAVPFLIAIVRNRQYDYSGKSTTLFQITVASKNKAGLLFLFFIFSGIYIGLSNFNIIPAIENAEKPRTYIELINNAENGREKPVDGKYQHEVYKESMDKFLKRHGRQTIHQ